jgi:hypothetical protein
MTPRSCSLYDAIKLKKLKCGIVIKKDYSWMPGFRELIDSGWIECRANNVVEYIELLR